jgi:tRNA threonylcarbamoyladenosine biosynthesis protein TsaB
MLVFALDTSTLQGSYGWIRVASSSPEKGVHSFSTLQAPAAPGHAETVLRRMTDLLVYGRGPGTFTGVRIGLSTIKGVAAACDTPVIGISSLEALALSSERAGLVAPIIDARRKELFSALFHVTLNANGWPEASPVVTEWVAPAPKVVEKLKSAAGNREVSLCGNGVEPYRNALTDGLFATVLPETASAPCPFWMARIGHRRFLEKGPDDLASVEPVYLREPDARLPSIKQR